MSDATARHVRRVAVHPRFFVEIMMHGSEAVDVVADALPEGTGYIMATWDPIGAVVWIIVEHDSFDPITEGEIIPEHPAPVFRRRPALVRMTEQRPTWWLKAYTLADDWLSTDAPITQDLGIELAETVISLCGRLQSVEQERDVLQAQLEATQKLAATGLGHQLHLPPSEPPAPGATRDEQG